MDLKGKKVLVLGFGRTGEALTRFLLAQGAQVTVTDKKARSEFQTDLATLENAGAAFRLGSHPLEAFLRSDLIVISPGVPPHLEALVAARKQAIPVVSEIELASWFISAPIIGITGTNGKTTTTTLVGEILRGAGFSVFVGGNIGTPLISFVAKNEPADYVVVELSSFQLEAIERFAPHIAVMLNLTEDHLDRYPSFDHYCQAKFQIFAHQTPNDFAIINRDDLACARRIPLLTSRVLSFSTRRFFGEGWYAEGQALYSQGREGARHGYSLSKVKLLGEHNRENMLAAIAVAELCGCPLEKIQESLDGFHGLHHRLEFVRTLGDVSFYNDSKATNIDALLKALRSFSGNVILIAGGREKGGDYSVLNEEMKKKVKTMILIGEAQEKFLHLFGSLVPTRLAAGLEAAVDDAYQSAESGDIVLLAPGCASFDMFANYEERGEKFAEAVRNLTVTRKSTPAGTPAKGAKERE